MNLTAGMPKHEKKITVKTEGKDEWMQRSGLFVGRQLANLAAIAGASTLYSSVSISKSTPKQLDDSVMDLFSDNALSNVNGPEHETIRQEIWIIMQALLDVKHQNDEILKETMNTTKLCTEGEKILKIMQKELSPEEGVYVTQPKHHVNDVSSNSTSQKSRSHSNDTAHKDSGESEGSSNFYSVSK